MQKRSEERRVGKEGNKVYQMLANYQRGVEGSRLGGESFDSQIDR